MAATTDRPQARRNGPVAMRGSLAETLDRQVPFDTEAERGVIGSIVLLPKLMADVGLILGPEDFHDTANAEIYRAMVALAAANRPIDPSLLWDRLRGSLPSNFGGEDDAAGKAMAYLTKTINCVPNAAHATYYAEIVREKSRLRKIIEVCTRGLREAYDELPADDVAANLDAKLSERGREVGEDAVPIRQVWDGVIRSLETQQRHGTPPAMLSGLPCADSLGFVFVGGELTLLAARPTVGKTSMATQIGMHHAGKGRTVLFCSLEMRADALASRVLMAAAGVNHQRVRVRGVVSDELGSLRSAAEDIGDVPFFVWAPGRVKVAAIRAMATAMKSRRDLRLLIVDYTSWIIPDDPRSQSRERVGEIIKGLRSIGQRLEIPVLLLHQLNREGASETPKLTHLRDSGCAEEDSDIVAFLHPAERPRDTPGNEPERVQLIVAKNRQGTVGETSLIWHREQTQFSDPADMPAQDRGNYDPSFAAFNQREFAP